MALDLSQAPGGRALLKPPPRIEVLEWLLRECDDRRQALIGQALQYATEAPLWRESGRPEVAKMLEHRRLDIADLIEGIDDVVAAMRPALRTEYEREGFPLP